VVNRKYSFAEGILSAGLHEVNVTHAQASAVEFEQKLVGALKIVSRMPLLEYCWHNPPGSGTSTICTSTLKSGPSFTTTPALHCFGISTSAMINLIHLVSILAVFLGVLKVVYATQISTRKKTELDKVGVLWNPLFS
jgi:hypothetical protein